MRFIGTRYPLYANSIEIHYDYPFEENNMISADFDPYRKTKT